MAKNYKDEVSIYRSYFQINSERSKYNLGHVAFGDPKTPFKEALWILKIYHAFFDVLLIMVSQQFSSCCSRLPWAVRSLVVSR